MRWSPVARFDPRRRLWSGGPGHVCARYAASAMTLWAAFLFALWPVKGRGLWGAF